MCVCVRGGGVDCLAGRLFMVKVVRSVFPASSTTCLNANLSGYTERNN